MRGLEVVHIIMDGSLKLHVYTLYVMLLVDSLCLDSTLPMQWEFLDVFGILRLVSTWSLYLLLMGWLCKWHEFSDVDTLEVYVIQLISTCHVCYFKSRALISWMGVVNFLVVLLADVLSCLWGMTSWLCFGLGFEVDIASL